MLALSHPPHPFAYGLSVGILATFVFSAATSAAEVLPLNDNYGNASGCHMVAGDHEAADDSAVYLTATSYGGWEWSCSYVWMSDGMVFGTLKDATGRFVDQRAWSAIALCSAEGEAY